MVTERSSDASEKCVRLIGRYAVCVQLPAVKSLTPEKLFHLAHWEWGVTNAFMEGRNTISGATKRKARSNRSFMHLITVLYFLAGKLRLPQF